MSVHKAATFELVEINGTGHPSTDVDMIDDTSIMQREEYRIYHKKCIDYYQGQFFFNVHYCGKIMDSINHHADLKVVFPDGSYVHQMTVIATQFEPIICFFPAGVRPVADVGICGMSFTFMPMDESSIYVENDMPEPSHVLCRRKQS